MIPVVAVALAVAGGGTRALPPFLVINLEGSEPVATPFALRIAAIVPVGRALGGLPLATNFANACLVDTGSRLVEL